MPDDASTLKEDYRSLRAPRAVRHGVLAAFAERSAPRYSLAVPLAAGAAIAAAVVSLVVWSGRVPEPHGQTVYSIASLDLPAAPGGMSRTTITTPTSPGSLPMTSSISAPSIDWSRL